MADSLSSFFSAKAKFWQPHNKDESEVESVVIG
jgi:hypothetical protein